MMNAARFVWGGALALAGLGLVVGAPNADAAGGRWAARHSGVRGRHAVSVRVKQPVRTPSDPSAGITQLEIAPASAVLDGPRTVQHVVVTATMQDGTTSDVTPRVALTVGNPQLAKVA